MTYTAISVVGVGFAVLLDGFVLRTLLVRRRAFWISYAIVLLAQLATNGVLTGQRIVLYDPGAILGDAHVSFVGDGRVAWAPVEDLLFGFSLVLQTLAWWTFWGTRESRLAEGRAGDRHSAA